MTGGRDASGELAEFEIGAYWTVATAIETIEVRAIREVLNDLCRVSVCKVSWKAG